MPCVSVVIPVYNVEPYLEECFQSIINQTMTDIEIIIIDDGSTDGSGRVCDKYANLDSRVKVIHKQNEGLSCVRNDGIEASNAPYIMFVDSDDWVEPDFCETAYCTAEENDADLVMFQFYRVDNDQKKIVKPKVKNQTGHMSTLEAMRYTVCKSTSVWSRLYKRELFTDVQYPKGKYYEDVGTTYKLIHKANRIWYINKPLYNYRSQRPGSITTSPETNTNADWKEMHILRISDLQNWGFVDIAQIDAFLTMVKYDCRDQKDLVTLAQRTTLKDLSDFSWRRKVMLVILKTSPCLFHYLCIITGKRNYKGFQKNQSRTQIKTQTSERIKPRPRSENDVSDHLEIISKAKK